MFSIIFHCFKAKILLNYSFIDSSYFKFSLCEEKKKCEQNFVQLKTLKNI